MWDLIVVPSLWVVLLTLIELISYKIGALKTKVESVPKLFFGLFLINLVSGAVFLLLIFLLYAFFLPVWVIMVMFASSLVYISFERKWTLKYIDEKDVFFIPFISKLITAGIMLAILVFQVM